MHQEPDPGIHDARVEPPATGFSHKCRRAARFLQLLITENRTEAVLVAVALLVLAVATIPSPYAVERPGPAADMLGTVPVDGEDVPVLTVEGQPHSESAGQLNLLTVSIAGSPDRPLSWIALIPALFDRSQEIAPVTDFYPEGITVEQREEVTSLQMDNSQVLAATAAFQTMGLEVGMTLGVGDVDPDGPAAGLLEAGDELLAVDSVLLEDFEQLTAAVAKAHGGLSITVLRDGETLTVDVTPRATNDSDGPKLGIVVSQAHDLPHDVVISVPQIGGPSAGLIFGLAIMERMGEGPNVAGLTISGTGTLSAEGDVGAIGGITQKAWAASRADSDLFLMPLENCSDVKGFPSGLNAVPVATLEEAVDAINAVSAGEPVAGLERCEIPSQK